MTILSVVTPAATQALTTPGTVRAALGLSEEDASDTQLARWIDQVSAAFATSCERVFIQERVVERVQSDGPLVWLTRRPVATVHGVKLWTTHDSWVELVSAEYDLLSPIDGRLMILSGRSVTIGLFDILDGTLSGTRARSARVDVDYTGGFATVPADLEALAITAVARLRAELMKSHPDLLSERLGDYAYTLKSTAAAERAVTGIMSSEVERGLAPYRKLALA